MYFYGEHYKAQLIRGSEVRSGMKRVTDALVLTITPRHTVFLYPKDKGQKSEVHFLGLIALLINACNYFKLRDHRDTQASRHKY